MFRTNADSCTKRKRSLMLCRSSFRQCVKCGPAVRGMRTGAVFPTPGQVPAVSGRNRQEPAM